MKKLMLSCLLLVAGFSLAAQKGYQIECKIKNVDAKEIYMAYHLGSKQYLKDTAQLVNGTYTFKGEEPLESGVYLVAIPPANTYFEILVDQKNQHFSIETESPDYNLHMKVKGSEDNKIFYEYVQYLGNQRKEAQGIQEQMQNPETTDAQMTQYEAKLEAINKLVETHQKGVIEKPGNYFVSKLIAANQEVRIPDAPEELVVELSNRYIYLYETITGESFPFPDERMTVHERINKNLEGLL